MNEIGFQISNESSFALNKTWIATIIVLYDCFEGFLQNF